MSDSRSLHDNAVLVRPKDAVKPSTIWVAVLHASKQPTGQNGEEDFLWIKCHGKIPAQTIRDQYEKRQQPGEKWVLKHDSTILANLQATMSELDTYRDQVIVFEAVKASDSGRLINARQPLQPKSTQTLSPSSNNGQKPTIESNENDKLSTLFRSRYSNYNNYNESLYPPPNGSLSPVTSRNSTPAVHAVSQPAVIRQGIHPSVDRRNESPARLQPRSLAAVPSPRNRNTFDNGFQNFHDSVIERVRADNPGKTEVQIWDSIHRTWADLLPAQRAPYQIHSMIDPASRGLRQELHRESALPLSGRIDEPPFSAAELDEQTTKRFQLPNLLKDAGPQMLESSVEQGVKLLDQLKAPLAARLGNNPDADQWIQQIENLRQQAVQTKTIIGVVGNTGAGKSSVINAMLDEERLVPTNCMRACTAVVTEISYNNGEEPYRAQIEFITSAEWEKELKTLFQDLLDQSGQVSSDCTKEDTDAGVAYAKIKAVYPRKTKEDIAKTDVATMLREVSHVLGSSRDVKETDSLLFYKKLQHFVDSKEKTTGDKEKDKKKKERREMEFWPLIRVVRIYVKSAALATGAVIVDLPGVHDANAARAAVAEGYMKQCTGLWIVAPINRAVDDKAAKSLLGESFKRQLKMDGGFNSVTFICSKTDDISLGEAQDSLGLDEEMAPSWLEMDELRKKQKSLKHHLIELTESKEVYSETVNTADDEIEIWDKLRDKFEDGQSVFAPKPKGAQKRKSRSKPKLSRKKLRKSSSRDSESSEHSDSDDEDFEDDDDMNTPSETEPSEQEPLTQEQIVAKLQELKATKKHARTQKTEIAEKATAVRKEIDQAAGAEEEISSKLSAVCISGRNQYSKGAIQQDFAAGIKELDQELAAEEDDENFDPDAEVRNYDEVARGLPVFCVSSRGYQKLQGRLRKDPDIAGFTSIEETEIPQLQAHCEKLTETGRSANCKVFINKLSQLLNSLTIWASSDGTGANLTPDQRAREARYLQKGLQTLESALENAVKSTCRELNDEFEDNIFDKYETAVSNAANDAGDTAFKWGMLVNRENRAAGGLHYMTYKAICRRDGVYTNAQGPHEWNVQLAEPMMKVIASGWEKTFGRRSPMVMANFGRHASAALRKFHRDIEARARKIGSSIAGLSLLQDQVAAYETTLRDLSTAVKDTVNTSQKEINREFIPVIQEAMTPAYTQCANERGTGSYARMKAAMGSHIENARHTMFRQSADKVRNRLHNTIEGVEEYMNEKSDEVFTQVRRDYRSVVGGGDVPLDDGILPKDQRLARKEVMNIIDGAERLFLKVSGMDVKEDEEEDDRENNVPGDDDGELDEVPSVKAELNGKPMLKQEGSPSNQLANADDANDSDEPAGPGSRPTADINASSEDKSETGLRNEKSESEADASAEHSSSEESD